MPQTGSWYAPTVYADSWTLSAGLIRDIPLTVAMTGVQPFGWGRSEGSLYSTSKYSTGNQMGEIRIRFKGNDWSSTQVSVLGENQNGVVQKWVAPDDWLCSGYTLLDLRMGSMEISEVWDAMRAESNGLWGSQMCLKSCLASRGLGCSGCWASSWPGWPSAFSRGL